MTMMVVMMVMMTLIKTSLIVINDSQMCLDLPWKAILYRAFSIKLKNVKYLLKLRYLLDKLQVAPFPHLFDNGSLLPPKTVTSHIDSKEQSQWWQLHTAENLHSKIA